MFKNKTILTIVSSIIVVGLAIGLTLFYRNYINSQVEEGDKEITIIVVDDTGEEKYSKTYTFNTDHNYLGELLDEKMDIEIKNTDWGRQLIVIDGIEADTTKEFWKLVINDKDADVGMDEL